MELVRFAPKKNAWLTAGFGAHCASSGCLGGRSDPRVPFLSYTLKLSQVGRSETCRRAKRAPVRVSSACLCYRLFGTRTSIGRKIQPIRKKMPRLQCSHRYPSCRNLANETGLQQTPERMGIPGSRRFPRLISSGRYTGP